MSTKFESRLPVDKGLLQDLLKRRFFYLPSFSIYGGYAGLYDYGPPGTALKANLLQYWRRHFVLEESMLEIDTVCLTPYEVLETSGHVGKFSDFMVRDVTTHRCYRADHLLEDAMEKLMAEKDITEEKKAEYELVHAKADEYSREELAEKLTLYKVKSPDTGNDITEPLPFNLMFETSIGPTGQVKGFLRPETAQGIFVNFPALLEQNGGKVPFAGAQIGQAFRNEIAPRSGLLRVREFTLAEIEHFVKPDEKDHPKFKSVAHLSPQFYPRKQQNTDQSVYKSTIGNAVKDGIINNETLGYFMGRVYLFLQDIGVPCKNLRFRQHLANEMSHYASDCWDAEILTSYGWIECVGIADRSCFDLTQHGNKTKARLTVYEKFPEPQLEEVTEPVLNKGALGKTFKSDAKILLAHLTSVDSATCAQYEKCQAAHAENCLELDLEGKSFSLTKDMISFKKVQKKINGRNIIPSVIEPSFGIGRIIYALLEQAFYLRKDQEAGKIVQAVLSFKPVVAPIKCAVLPLSSSEKFDPVIQSIASDLNKWAVSNKVDSSASAIGRRYARADEIGTPFAITVDFQTLEDNTVTLRERDSCSQIRLPASEVAELLGNICTGRSSWEEAIKSREVIQHD